MNKRELGKALLASAFALAVTTGTAAAYPDKPITLIVPFSPGGGTDLSARMIAPYIEKYLGDGAEIVIENRAGAGGDVGATAIALAEPDGYTIGFMNVPNTMMKSHERETRWTVDSFDPIANLVLDPAVLTVRADSPFQTLGDVIEAAKARPGEITVSSAGVGSNTHLDLMRLETAAGVDFTHVPFDGGAAARNALLGGHVDLAASALGDMQRFSDDGEVRMVGILTSERFPLAPDVPTYAEQGYPLEGGAARGLVGPKGMPQEAIDAIASAVEKALQDQELIDKTKEIALPLLYMGPAAYGEYLQRSDAELAEVWASTPWVE
ncbi:tripartite tricarboxylate transporter substrate binding protein [Acuticoccus kandeliae]|uniref:tripartite tricarboxylate transporter substrate binding protein n=1 Tax=Acuticoccus kandeliae TaxID=2073160 RepID=UPI000D3EC980|nr:tripartite tricarboxylate transporter substrate binding protein [Acuticoccus kandeliae]